MLGRGGRVQWSLGHDTGREQKGNLVLELPRNMLLT